MLSSDGPVEAIEAALHLEPQPRHVPVELAGVAHRLVRKAVDLGDRQRTRVELPQDGAAALGPQIKREKTIGHAPMPYNALIARLMTQRTPTGHADGGNSIRFAPAKSRQEIDPSAVRLILQNGGAPHARGRALKPAVGRAGAATFVMSKRRRQRRNSFDSRAAGAGHRLACGWHPMETAVTITGHVRDVRAWWPPPRSLSPLGIGGPSPDIPFRDPHARRRRQRNRRGRRHQPRRPPRHRVRGGLVRGTGLDPPPVPRAELHEQLRRRLQRPARRRERRRLSRTSCR